ncbi:MAG: hypothetical protein ACREJ3_07000, partial [Polyangiaceae bacterium]
IVPGNPNCNEANQTTVNGWNVDNGRIRICGPSCANIRNTILGAAAGALKANQPAPDVPITATLLCASTGQTSDAGASAGQVADASAPSDGGSTFGSPDVSVGFTADAGEGDATPDSGGGGNGPPMDSGTSPVLDGGSCTPNSCLPCASRTFFCCTPAQTCGCLSPASGVCVASP